MTTTETSPDQPEWTRPPWEPPLASTEAEHLLGSLEKLRATFFWKASGLDHAALQVTIGASALTLGQLLKHLAVVEDDITTDRLTGASIGEPWETIWAGGMDWQFTSAGDDSPEELYALWLGAVARSRSRVEAALAVGGLDQLVHVDDGRGNHASLRRLLHDLVEEYGRHTGHADLLREAVDGLVGEDPPADIDM